MMVSRKVFLGIILGAAMVALFCTKLAIAQSTADQTEINFYGYVKADAIYDFKRMNPEWNSTMRPSQIPIGDMDDTEDFYEDGEFVFSVKSSRLGTDIVHSTDGHDIRAKVEIDFYGTGTNSGHMLPRVRHAYVSFGQFLVGQAWSLFSSPDASPATLDFWGPCGLMLSRRPQIRWTPVDTDGSQFAFALEKPGTSLDSGKGPSIDPEFFARSHNQMPDFTAMYKLQGDWGFVQLAGLARSLGYEGGTNDTPFSGSEFGGGGNIHARIKTQGSSGLLLQFAHGVGISNYANDGGYDLSGDGQGGAKALPFTGWSVAYETWWNEKWSTTLSGSQTLQENSGGQTDNAFKTGTYTSLNLVYHPLPKLLYGLEVLWGERENNDGRNNDDYRVQFSGKYMF